MSFVILCYFDFYCLWVFWVAQNCFDTHTPLAIAVLPRFLRETRTNVFSNDCWRERTVQKSVLHCLVTLSFQKLVDKIQCLWSAKPEVLKSLYDILRDSHCVVWRQSRFEGFVTCLQNQEDSGPECAPIVYSTSGIQNQKQKQQLNCFRSYFRSDRKLLWSCQANPQVGERDTCNCLGVSSLWLHRVGCDRKLPHLSCTKCPVPFWVFCKWPFWKAQICAKVETNKWQQFHSAMKFREKRLQTLL